MAPEQVRGKTVDRRADIWAFGCVLYEMLVGRQPFAGESLADTLGAIVKDQPRWENLPPATPPTIRRLLMRCLVKDPLRRLRDIGEARIALEEELTGAAGRAFSQRRRGPRGSLGPYGCWRRLLPCSC
jgi:serine/threonine-protein kinase